MPNLTELTMVDFNELTGSARLYNLHSHTQFCDGRAQMEAFAAAAVEAGFSVYGFTPHSPIGFHSPCNMLKDNVRVYLDEVKRLQALYDGRIRFLAGMEIDYIDDEWGPAAPYFQQLPLDYRIGSVHFVPADNEYVDIDGRFDSFVQKMERYFHNDIHHVVRLFFRQSLAMVEAGGFDIVGHIDKIAHNASMFHPGIENDPEYLRLINRLIDAVIAGGYTVELNTKAWREHTRMFPAPVHLHRLLQAGVPIVVNSDAHVPALINAGREAGFQLLNSLSTNA